MHLKKLLLFLLAELLFCFIVLSEDKSLIALADEEFNYRYQLIGQESHELIQAFCPRLERAIELYWEALTRASSESMLHILFQLARGYYELAACCDTLTVKKIYFEKGITYGRKWIEVQLSINLPDLSQAEFQRYIQEISNPGILFWLAQDFGGYLESQAKSGDVTVLHNIGTKVTNLIVLYRRSIELNPDYFGANALSSLGSLLVFLPPFLGGDFREGMNFLEKARQTHPEFLYNQVLYIKSLYFQFDLLKGFTPHKKANRDKVAQELLTILELPLDEYPFWNALAKKEAERLLKEIQKRGDQ